MKRRVLKRVLKYVVAVAAVVGGGERQSLVVRPLAPDRLAPTCIRPISALLLLLLLLLLLFCYLRVIWSVAI